MPSRSAPRRFTSAPGLLAPLVALTALAAAGPVRAQSDEELEPLDPPPAYAALTSAGLEAVGAIRDVRITLDRVELELTEGDLYLRTLDTGQAAIAVYLGDGVMRAYPPDGIEHHQLERYLDDDDSIDEEFDRFVLWSSDGTGERLRALVSTPTPRRDRTDRANDLVEDRREELFEEQKINPDARVLADALDTDAGAPPTHGYLLAEFDTDDHDWVTLEVDPRQEEEVQIFRFDRHRDLSEVWMGTQALWELDDAGHRLAREGFARDPETEGKVEENEDDDDDWHARDLGLPRRPRPATETWAPRVTVARTDVDLAIEGNGDVQGRAALVVTPTRPLATVRLLISQVLQVTDVRWSPAVPEGADDVLDVPLLTGTSEEPDEPVDLVGERLPFVQEIHNRRLDEDLYEPSVTIALPRSAAAGEPILLSVAYEGELFEDLRGVDAYVLKDTTHWLPRHPDTWRMQLGLTVRTPDDLVVASGGELVDDRVEDDTRIVRWVSTEPVRSMSLTLGQFDVWEVETDRGVPVTVYADESHLGFAPGNREKTLDDLIGSIATYEEYFGPYPFPSLRATETRTTYGQAFPGFVLLSFAAFGPLHTGEAEAFRAHEVAHQWWGASVNWQHYRDQWISEGFAQYAAALFTRHQLDRDDRFLAMLDAWSHDILARVNVGQGLGMKQYGMLPQIIQRSDGHEAGPLVAGFRLASPESPFDYRILVYEKGAFVLHMLRSMLMDPETGDDTRFRELMRGFVADHQDRLVTTAAFEAAVDTAFGEPMAWFFDQWVYGVDVPTYRVDLDVSPLIDQASPFALHGTIRQEDVPGDFRMPVPIRLTFDDRDDLVVRVWVDAPEVEVEIPLPAEPRDVEFNDRHAVLAHVRD